MSVNVHLTSVNKVGGIDAATNEYFIDVIGNKADASDNTAGTASAIALLRYIIANLSTDADVVALLGAVDTAGATGAVTDVDVMMAYIKQLVTQLLATDAVADLTLVDTTAIVADTNELQTDWTNGGRLDLILDELTVQGDTNETKLDTNQVDLDAIIAGTITNAGGADVATDVVAAQVVIDETNGYLEAGGDIHDVLYADAAGASLAVDIAANQADLNTLIATNGSADSSGTFSYLDAGAEQDVVELTNSTRKTVSAIWVDAINLTNNGTFKVYYKVDGTNYRELVANAATITAGTDEAINLIAGNLAITEDLKVTYTEASDEGAARDIPFSVIYETKE